MFIRICRQQRMQRANKRTKNFLTPLLEKVTNSQWTVNLIVASNGASIATVVASQRYSAPLSESFVTRASSLLTTVPLVEGVSPESISSSPLNHLSSGGGLPP